MAKDIEREAAELRAEIEKHNRLYYLDAAPIISDREFDRLLQRLTDLETAHPELITPDSPTQRVGGAPLTAFATVTHSVPMLSIDNTYSFDEIREWDARIRKALNPGEPVRYTVELKVDGGRGVAPLRKRHSGSRRDPRRRRARRRRDRQSPYRPRDPARAR